MPKWNKPYSENRALPKTSRTLFSMERDTRIEPAFSLCLPAVLRWSEIRESNSRLLLGKQAYYHCTNLAQAKQAGEARILPLNHAHKTGQEL